MKIFFFSAGFGWPQLVLARAAMPGAQTESRHAPCLRLAVPPAPEPGHPFAFIGAEVRAMAISHKRAERISRSTTGPGLWLLLLQLLLLLHLLLLQLSTNVN